MQRIPDGRPFHGEFSSADASALNEASSRFGLYGMGSTTAITLASNEQVVITDLSVIAGAALTVTLYDGADATAGAGEVIAKGSHAANGGERGQLATPHFCQQGTYPKVKTSGAGQIDGIIRGIIVRNGQ